MNLLSSFGKSGAKLDLMSRKVDVKDEAYLSKYFIVAEHSPILTAGKNSITFNGSNLLKPNSEILVECIDANGNNLYIELARSENVTYKEAGGSYVVSLHVYGDTAAGVGKFILLGTTAAGHSVRWVSNITIDKTRSNDSTVRFYDKPSIEVNPLQAPLLANTNQLIYNTVFSGSFYAYSVTPRSGVDKSHTNNLNLDYRIVDTRNDIDQLSVSSSFNSQLINYPVTLKISKIKDHQTNAELDVNITQSFVIKDVLNYNTIKLDVPFYYENNTRNKIVTDILSGQFEVDYPYIKYNISELENIELDNGTTKYILKQSLAEITYRNIRTYTGFIARHKLYRKSLFSTGEFENIADEPLSIVELLADNLTLNKSFYKIGNYYNQDHINRYWFSSSNKLNLIYSTDKMMDSLYIKSNNSPNDFDGKSIYVIAKNDTDKIHRTPAYFPYDKNEYQYTSGSHYDSNFIQVKKDVQYVLTCNILLENPGTTSTEGGIRFYLTSSLLDASKTLNYDTERGIKIGEYNTLFNTNKEVNKTTVQFLFTCPFDLYGTIVIYPYLCNARISNLSFMTYGDDGFSPDVLTTRIQFPVRVFNEIFEIKAELFDINSNLIYSDLKTTQTFDTKGETLTSYNLYYPFIKPENITTVAASLTIPQDLEVGRMTIIHSGSLVRFYNLVKTYDLNYTLGMENVGGMPSPASPYVLLNDTYPTETHKPSIDPINSDDKNGRLYYSPTKKFWIQDPYILYAEFDENKNEFVKIGSTLNVMKIRERIKDPWPEDNIDGTTTTDIINNITSAT